MFYKWTRWTAKKDGYLARAEHFTRLREEACAAPSNTTQPAVDWLCFIMIWKECHGMNYHVYTTERIYIDVHFSEIWIGVKIHRGLKNAFSRFHPSVAPPHNCMKDVPECMIQVSLSYRDPDMLVVEKTPLKPPFFCLHWTKQASILLPQCAILR